MVINYNKLSDQFLKAAKFKLSDKKYEQILIPPKFGNAHLVTSNKAIFTINSQHIIIEAVNLLLNGMTLGLK